MSEVEDPKPRPITTAENEPANQELTSVNGPKPRQWLMDRSNGCSKIQEEELGRPFCPMCWPPPCVKYCPDTLEQNSCCECIGNVGAFPEDHDCSRIWLMRKSMFVHFTGLVLSILSCLAITTIPDMLQNFAYSDGTVTGYVGSTDVQKVEMYVGLRAVLVKDYFGTRTYAFDELCSGSSYGIPLTSAADCHACSDASSGLVFTVLMGVVTYLPTIASNVNRAYYNYDVNCQKAFGTIVALFSMFMSLYTWQGYANNCFGSFFDGDVTIPVLTPKGANLTNTDEVPQFQDYEYYDEFDQSVFLNRTWEDIEQNPLTIEELFPGVNASVIASSEVHIARVNFDWKPGTGLLLIVVATFLKMIDILNHFLIRTPSITRDHQEQLEYEEKYGGSNGSKTEEVGEANKEEVQGGER